MLCLIILNMYHPPGPATTFFIELQDILSYISAPPPRDLALMGDFSLCIESSSFDVGQLSVILESFDLHQYVDFPTHIHDHSLDLISFSSGCNVISVSTSDLILDHFSVVTDLQIPSNCNRTNPETIKYRKLQPINIEAFKADMINSKLIGYLKTDATKSALQ